MQDHFNQQSTSQHRYGLNWINTILFVVGKPVKLQESALHTTPWLTRIMIVLISFISILAWMPEFREPMFNAFAFYPDASGGQWFAGLFTCAVLHGGWAHLLGNMYFFWLFGRHVECRFGRRRMIGLFLIATALGAWIHGMFSEAPLVGASGGIFGVLAFYALLFPKSRILWVPFVGFFLRIFMLNWDFIRKGFPVRVYLGVFMAYQVVLLHSQLFGDGNVSALGHLGGGLAGVVIYFGWQRGLLP